MHPDYPAPPPFVEIPDRESVTHEPPLAGGFPVAQHNDREWIDSRNQGGGYVPPTHEWTSNPKQEHDLDSVQ